MRLELFNAARSGSLARVEAALSWLRLAPAAAGSASAQPGARGAPDLDGLEYAPAAEAPSNPSPLFVAARAGHAAVVARLVQAGANPNRPQLQQVRCGGVRCSPSSNPARGAARRARAHK